MNIKKESQKGFQMEFQTVTKVTRLKCFPSELLFSLDSVGCPGNFEPSFLPSFERYS